MTPAEAKARTDSYVAHIQRALDEIAEDHVYRAVRMLEGEEPDTSLTLYHEGSVTYRAATGAILKACRNLALARYKAHFDTGWIPAEDDDGEEDGDNLDDDEDAVTAPGKPP